MPLNPTDSIVYGIHPVTELITSKIRSIDRIYFANEQSTSALFDVVKLARKERLPYQMVPPVKLDYLAGTTKHQGAVAVCSAMEYTAVEDLMAKLAAKTTAPLLLVPASVEDPGNLGAIIRTSVGFGVDALLLERKNTAPIGSTVAKASAGMLEYMPLVKPKNLEGLITTLASEGYAIIGADIAGDKKPDEVDLCKPSVIILGGEHKGIPPYLAKQCTSIVAIPMAQNAQSFNVSASAAMVLYECCRQRKFVY